MTDQDGGDVGKKKTPKREKKSGQKVGLRENRKQTGRGEIVEKTNN